MSAPLPWEDPDAPDIVWTCALFRGRAVLALQAETEMLSAHLLARDYNTVQVRTVFDPDKLPDVVAQKFIVFVDGSFLDPVLASDPDPLLKPLERAIHDKQPWWLIIQVVVEGKPHMRMFTVHPDGNTEPTEDPGGDFPAGDLWPKWIVGIK